jgi:hypothetical protein
MFTAFQTSPEAEQLHWLVRTCLLARTGGVDAKRILQVAQKAQASPWRASERLCTLAAAHYRAGQDREAIARCEDLLAVREPPERWHKVLSWLVLALARQRQGHHAEARKWLDQAVAEMERPVQVPNAAATEDLPYALDWSDFLLCQLWRREAENLIRAGKP